MSETTDIYEWMEIYLLGKLSGAELAAFEEKIRSCSDFAEDLHVMEIEMYEESRLPPDRQKIFEERLKQDANLARELALHIATFEVAKLFDKQGNCSTSKSLIDTSLFTKNEKPASKTHSINIFHVVWKRAKNILQSVFYKKKDEHQLK